MPYVDLYSEDDYASIFYTTTTPCGNVSAFDPEKPTVIILHPFLLDSTWVDQQMGDHRLYKNYNMIAFDMRTCGRSSSRPNARHDSWVEAADLAFCHQKLYLPPCHILALESLSVYCAMRFAVLFPELCLSLTLCNVPSPRESEWMLATYGELLQLWCNTEDLDTFEHVMKECVTLLTGGNLDLDLQDELISYWQMNMPPSRKVRIAETFGVLMHRVPLEMKAFMKIKQPVLILHGENNMERKWADKLQAKLVNASGGAVVYTVAGASSTLSINPIHASIANGTFHKFISRLPKARSDLRRPQVKLLQRMHEALDELAELVDDPSISGRNPASSISFSCMPELLAAAQKETLMKLQEDVMNPQSDFSPLGPDGRPWRKYSQKISEHWFHGLSDGLSIADNKFLVPPNDPMRAEKSSSKEKLPTIREIIIEKPEKPEKELVRPTARRGTFNAGSNIQHSMAKVVSNVHQSTFALIL